MAGADTHDGLSQQTAVRTLRRAAAVAGSGARILVMQVGCDWRRAGHVTTCSPLIGQGEYNNNNYGAGNNNGAVVTLKAGAGVRVAR